MWLPPCCFIAIYFSLSSAEIEKPESIMGGQFISITNAPWQLSLQRRPIQQLCRPMHGRIHCLWRYGDWKHICGASLIDSRWAVTVRHCVHDPTLQNNPEKRLSVVAGMTYFVEGGTRSLVQRVFFNETANDDFALLKLREPIVNRPPFIKSIAIASPNVVLDNQWCFTTGWGRSDSQEVSTTLKSAWVFIRPSNYPDCAVFGRIAPWDVCVQDSVHSYRACKGDSGGPLTCYVDNKPYLFGATSLALEGCPKQFPVLYVRIPYFLSAIEDIVTNTTTQL